MTAYENADAYSRAKINSLRSALAGLPKGDYSVMLGGSYARMEASTESDLDYYVVAETAAESEAKEHLASIASILTETIKAPGSNGPFGKVHITDRMLTNIGGDGDRNLEFTIRMLFLIEGEWLLNQELFNRQRKRLIERYIQPQIRQEQLGRFFLNDVIRYYRTMCVDFENKTSEGNKAWGPRNIKLVFSRKLLYFGGVVVAAELSGLPYGDKVDRMESLLKLPPLERLRSVFGAKADDTIRTYDHFLQKFSDANVRHEVAQVRSEDDSRETNEVFRTLKDKGHEFSRGLIELLHSKYPQNHPIHVALLM